MVIALLSYHDWHLHIILTHWSLLAFTDESEGQCHTHLCARAYTDTHKLEFARSHTGAHTKVDHWTHLHIQISLWCSMSLMCEHERQGLPVPQAAVSASVWANSRPPWAMEHWSLCQLKEMESPFSLSAIVCVCVRAHGKSNKETRGLGLALNSVSLL